MTRPDDRGVFVAATFNVRQMPAKDGPNAWEFRRDLLLETVRGLNADVLGTQEPFEVQVNAIAEALPEHERIGIGRDDGIRAGEWSALFVRRSRFAVVEQGNFWYSETPDRPGTCSWDSSHCNRLCTWALLEDRESGGRFYVYNSHWDHQGERARQHSAGMLAARMTERAAGVPALLMGDFNAQPDSIAVQYLTGESGGLDLPGGIYPPSPHLRDAWTTVHPDEPFQGTFHGFGGDAERNRIDYLLATEGIDILDCTINRTNREGRYPSDHFPVVAHLRLTDQTKEA